MTRGPSLAIAIFKDAIRRVKSKQLQPSQALCVSMGPWQKDTCELLWVNFVIELDFPQPSSMELKCNNQVGMHISPNLIFHERTKHMEIDCYFITEKAQK